MFGRQKRKLLLLFIVLIALFPVPFPAFGAGEVRYVNTHGQDYVYLSDVAGYYGMKYAATGNNFVLSSKYSRLIFINDKKYCYINNVKVALLFPCVAYKSYQCISSKDFLLTVDPIMRHWALRKHGLKRIMLDPGHGGKDKGGIGRRLNEKILTLPLAFKVAGILQQKGYEVFLTRTSDRFIELRDRPELARKVNADVFVSIHANKAADSSVTGIETFCLTPNGASSTHSRSISWKKYPGNVNTANNTALAYCLQRSLIAATGAEDRGLKHARFMVLKEASCPAALVEVGFLSNPTEESRIAADWYQAKLARAIAEGIMYYDHQLRRRK
ncbi:MAG: N-acetylmuramoyl-L-alanine amidase [Victivallales bacterium]|nr:N-acetylmuramoyl-L-alanine amidase [Victivallales bacterium]